MIDLRTLFKNHLNTDEVSDDNVFKFADDHLNRLKSNNGAGHYTAMIAATEPKVLVFRAAVNVEDFSFSAQQGDTMVVDDVIAKFQAEVRQREGIVRGTFGEHSPQYQTFFPHGLTEYSQATKGNVDTLIARIVQGATLYQADLGAGFLAIFTQIQTDYLAARQTQLQQIGTVDAAKTTTSTTRDTLEVQLMTNILTLAVEFLGNPARGMDFFDQSIIRRKNSPADGSLNPLFPKDQSLVVVESKGITAQTDVTGTNTGTTGIMLGMSVDGLTLDPKNAVTIQPGETQSFTAGTFGPGTILVGRNLSSTDDGHLKVMTN